MGLTCFLLAATAGCGQPLPDDRLAVQRGGFSLPTGIEVALTVDTQTAVDGAVVLRSIFRIDQGAPQATVYVPRDGEAVAATPVRTDRGGGGVDVRYDRQTGVQVVATPRVQVGGQAGAIQSGLVAAEAGKMTDHGVVVIDAAGRTQTAGLRAAGLDITHLAGAAIGSAIANAADGRAIDTRTSVGIDLRNVGPDVLGSAMLQAQSLASDAVMGRVR